MPNIVAMIELPKTILLPAIAVFGLIGSTKKVFDFRGPGVK